MGHLAPEQVQRVAELHDQLQGVVKELDLQFRRISQIQAQLDSILSQAKP